MLEITVAREELMHQLLPFKWNDSVILSLELNKRPGLFGVKNNMLFFISYEKLDVEVNLEVPKTIEEIEGLFLIGEWVLYRAMMTPKMNVQLDTDIFFNKGDILKPLQKFVKNYARNTKKWGCKL